MTKQIKAVLALWWIFSSMMLLGVDITEPVYNENPVIFSFDAFLMSHAPGGFFFPMFIENYVPDATFLTEESNGFALLDNPRVYFEGDSINQFNWSLNGFNINSSLNDGSPALLAPFSSMNGMEMRNQTPGNRLRGFNFISSPPEENGSRFNLSAVNPNMGGTLARFLIQPEHPFERADRLYETRRKFNGDFQLDYRWTRRFNQSAISVSANYINQKRQFNNFNLDNTVFTESGALFSSQVQYSRQLNEGGWMLFGLFNRLTRSNQDAELGAPPQETADKDRYAAMAGFHLGKKNLDVRFSLLWEQETLKPTAANYSKELMDTDGDGFYPFLGKLGTFNALTINGAAAVPIKSGPFSLDLYADARCAFLSGQETPNAYNAIFMGGAPWLVLQQTTPGNYHNANADARLGAQMEWRLSPDISLLAQTWLQYNQLDFKENRNDLNFLTPGFDVGVTLFKNKRFNVQFAYGRIPYDLRENVNSFLETSRPGGAYYRWRDRDGDRMFDPGETGTVYGYSGGAVHFLDDGISAPLYERWLLTVAIPVSRTLTFDIKGLYKNIINNFRVRFNKEYGHYETLENRTVYWFNQPFSDYVLTNHYLSKEPFYAQLLLRLHGGRTGKWYFSFSFMAHMGMGDTAFGNGPGSNDIGILHESQADPNSWINGFGRVDGDRGFIAKSYFGFYLSRPLFLGVSFKYRDGNPFAFINTYYTHRQYILQYDTIKAEDKNGKKGGPREDYIGDLSIALNYSFQLFGKPAVFTLGIYNILDVGCELSEYVFSGGDRDSREIQIPRSMRLNLQWSL